MPLSNLPADLLERIRLFVDSLTESTPTEGTAESLLREVLDASTPAPEAGTEG